jgi:protein phosphatase 1 regulatory subunit 7
LTSISGLSALTNLEELYISHNALSQISGLDANTQLRVLDISNNPITHLENLSSLSHLEEFWASNCQIDDFAEVERELRGKAELTTVYLEGNPLQLKSPAVYRNKIRLALPQVKQIDASESHTWTVRVVCDIKLTYMASLCGCLVIHNIKRYGHFRIDRSAI